MITALYVGAPEGCQWGDFAAFCVRHGKLALSDEHSKEYF